MTDLAAEVNPRQIAKPQDVSRALLVTTKAKPEPATRSRLAPGDESGLIVAGQSRPASVQRERRRRATPARPANPTATSENVAGSGTGTLVTLRLST
ncbi:hypothetical protein MASR1M101_13500 [Gemmatimonas sp.]